MLPLWEIVMRLMIALVLGALIGLERESKDHAAGLRTNALVALGCALFTIISAFGFRDLLNLPNTRFDPSRIASYIVAGIGFLGGGAIFVQRNKERVKGMTTAAAIWVVAAIGMASGAGLLWEAAISTVLVLIVLSALHLVERILIPARAPGQYRISIEAIYTARQFIGQVHETCEENGLTVEHLDVHSDRGTDYVDIACRAPTAKSVAYVLGALRELPGVKAINSDLRVGRKGKVLVHEVDDDPDD